MSETNPSFVHAFTGFVRVLNSHVIFKIVVVVNGMVYLRHISLFLRILCFCRIEFRIVEKFKKVLEIQLHRGVRIMF